MPRKPRGRSVTGKRTPPAKRGGSAADRKLPVPPEELERAVASALQKVEVSAIISEKFAGPLPHPEHLQQYEAIYGTVGTVVWEDGWGNPASYPIPLGYPWEGGLPALQI